jgi:NAD kinase
MTELCPLHIGEWYRVVDGFHTGEVGVLMKVEEANFGRLYAELVIDERRIVRCRATDLEPA